MTNSKPSEAELARAYREASQQPTWPGPDCPSTAALEGLVTGASEPSERQRLADHLVECGQCAALVRELRSLADWAEKVSVEPRRRRWPLALAASLAMLVGAAFMLLQAPQPRVAAVRGTLQTVRPAPGADLTQPPQELSWPAQDGASGYRVELRDATGSTLWQGSWELGATCQLPDQVAAEMVAGVYLWTVEMRGAARASHLGPYTFSVSSASR